MPLPACLQRGPPRDDCLLSGFQLGPAPLRAINPPKASDPQYHSPETSPADTGAAVLRKERGYGVVTGIYQQVVVTVGALGSTLSLGAGRDVTSTHASREDPKSQSMFSWNER